MRDWFILFLFLSYQLIGFNLLGGGNLHPPSQKLSVSADETLTVPIGSSGTGEGTGYPTGPETGYGTWPVTEGGTETGED